MKKVIALHEIDEAKLVGVMAEMRRLGAPTIRVIEEAGRFWAVEGTHRLEAAKRLGLTPRIEVIDSSDPDAIIDSLDLDGEGQSMTVGDVLTYVCTMDHGAIYAIDE